MTTETKRNDGIETPRDDRETFVRASLLLECETCGETGLHPSEVCAVRPRNHAVMMCSECMPDPPEEWL